MKFLKFRSASSYAGHHEQPPPFPAAIYNIENPGFASAWSCLTSPYRTRLHLDADNPRPTRPLSPPARRTTTGYRQRTFYNLTTRHRPTAHRDERTGAPASQRIASQSRHDWKRRHPSSRTTGRTWHSTEQDSRDGKERRVPTTTTRTCKFTFRARCSNPDASVSAWGAWRQAAGPHCPFGLLGARTLVENLVFLTPLPPPCEDYRERPGRDVWCRTALFSAVLLPTLRPDPEESIFTDMAADTQNPTLVRDNCPLWD